MSDLVVALLLGTVIGYCLRVLVTTVLPVTPPPVLTPQLRPRRRRRPQSPRSPLDSLEFTVLSHQPIEPEELERIARKLARLNGHRCAVTNVSRSDYPAVGADGLPLRGIAMNPESWFRAGSHMDQICQRALDVGE